MRLSRLLVSVCILPILTPAASAQVAGKSGANDLVIADAGKTAAVVAVSPAAGTWEKRAAADLARYVGRMTGAEPKVAATAADLAAALKAQTPVLIVGRAALEVDPTLKDALAKAAKPNPTLRAD